MSASGLVIFDCDALVTGELRAAAGDASGGAGAGETIAALRELGWQSCLASQTRIAQVKQTLALTGLDDLFPPERVFSAAMVARPKPAPDLFVHAARECGWEPAECVVVEDTVTGVRAARAAGMRVLGYAARGRPEDEAMTLAAAGAQVVRDMAEVPARV